MRHDDDWDEPDDVTEPDPTARGWVFDAIRAATAARQTLATDTIDGPDAVRLHDTATRLGELVFNLCQDTRDTAIDAVRAAGGQTTVDGQTWHLETEPYGATQLVRGPRPTRRQEQMRRAGW